MIYNSSGHQDAIRESEASRGSQIVRGQPGIVNANTGRRPPVKELLMEQTAKHVVFQGRVQGVGFRYTANEIAARYNLTGFVRNLPDGTVEMLVQGDATEIDNCLADIQGVFADHIRGAQIESVPYHSRYTSFRITF